MTSIHEIVTQLYQHSAVQAVYTRTLADRTILYVVPTPRRSPRINGQVRYSLPNGMAIVTANQREASNQYHEFFTEQQLLQYGLRIDDGDCIFDLGANIGLFTLFAQSKNTTVYAIEPAPTTFALLSANTKLYGHHVYPLQVGVADQEGEALFSFYPWSPTLSGFYERSAQQHLVESARRRAQAVFSKLPRRHEDEHKEEGRLIEHYLQQLETGTFPVDTLSIPVTTISALIREHRVDRIDLLKIDVEGAEAAVLRGIAEADWPKIRQLIVEIHQEALFTLCQQLISQHGFTIEIEQTSRRGSGTYHIYAHRIDAAPIRSTAEPSPMPSLIKDSQPLTTAELLTAIPELGTTSTIELLILEKLPKTADDAVDEAALPLPNTTGEILTAMEQDVQQICADLFEKPVSLDEDLLERGANFPLLIQLASQIAKHFQVILPISFMATGPFNVRTIAQTVDENR